MSDRCLKVVAVFGIIACVAFAAACGRLGSGGGGSGGRDVAADPVEFGFESIVAEGTRPLLVVLIDYSDMSFRHTPANYDQLIFGPSQPNIADYFLENSRGRFTWSKADILGPFEYPDDPDTTADESKYCASPDTCPFIGLVNLQASNGQYLGAEGGGGSTMHVNRDRAGAWEGLSLIDMNGGLLMSGDLVNLKTLEGYYVVAVDGGNGEVRADSTEVGLWETFGVSKVGGGEIVHGDSIGFRVYSGHYVVAEDGGGGGLYADSDAIGPWETFTLQEATTDLTRFLRHGLESAAGAGFVFADYDTDGDGNVSQDELGLLVIGAGPFPSNGATSWDAGCLSPTGSSVQVCTSGVIAGEGVSFATIAHELSHFLGATDIYGSSSLSFSLSLMSSTIVRFVEDNLNTFHLDPWHKIQLGWVRPRIYLLDDPVGSASLLVAQYPPDDRGPVILYDAGRGTNEYFILEARAQNTPIGGGYDANVADTGLAVWQVKTNEAKELLVIPGLASGEDASLFTLGAPDGARGGNLLWKDTDGVFGFQWLDGTDSRLNSVRVVEPISSTPVNVEVEW